MKQSFTFWLWDALFSIEVIFSIHLIFLNAKLGDWEFWQLFPVLHIPLAKNMTLSFYDLLLPWRLSGSIVSNRNR